MEFNKNLPKKVYQAAGTVVINEDKVLMLLRPELDEVRLPKGHIDPGETALQAALRETQEESGFSDLEVLAPLGEQVVEFTLGSKHVMRQEFYFLAKVGANTIRSRHEKQFIPSWMPWEMALQKVTFEAEREWLRRAFDKARQLGGQAAG